MQILYLLLFLVVVVGGYFSFIMLPRQRAYSRHYKTVSTMQVGQEVVTFGGIVGTIKRIDAADGLVTVEVAPGVELRLVAMSVHQEFDPQSLRESAKKATR